jgi:hypothetical protein
MNNQPEDVLAGSWIIDSNDEVVRFPDDMFVRGNYTEEIEARTLAGLAAMDQADSLFKERLADLRYATGLTQSEVARGIGVSKSGVAAIELLPIFGFRRSRVTSMRLGDMLS